MATELKMPALSPTMEEGTLAKWLVKEGDDVKSIYVRWMKRGTDRPLSFVAKPDASVTYNGAPLTVRMR